MSRREQEITASRCTARGGHPARFEGRRRAGRGTIKTQAATGSGRVDAAADVAEWTRMVERSQLTVDSEGRDRMGCGRSTCAGMMSAVGCCDIGHKQSGWAAVCQLNWHEAGSVMEHSEQL